MTLSSVPVFILAGGMGTRLSEETQLRPKPMVEIGETPILVHIMRHYFRHGFNNFVICAGYKAWEIKNYFATYQLRSNHFDLDLREGSQSWSADLETCRSEKWRVRVIDTGLETMTGSRIARSLALLSDEPFEHFAVTYGDGVSDVDLKAEFEHHLQHGQIGTVLAVKPDARWGELNIDENGNVRDFVEKSSSKLGRINGGFFFFRRDFSRYIDQDSSCILETRPLEKLARDGQLNAFIHSGFWHPMDTLRDKNYLQSVYEKKAGPWASP